MATVTIEKEGQEKVFTGIGDAAPNSVAPAMLNCLIRMAETRAKARALRDAVNVSVSAFEELGEDDSQPTSKPQYPEGEYTCGRKTKPVPNRIAYIPTRPNYESRDSEIGKATPQQVGAIRSLCQKQGVDPDTLSQEKYQSLLTDITSSQASDLIRSLNQKASLVSSN